MAQYLCTLQCVLTHLLEHLMFNFWHDHDTNNMKASKQAVFDFKDLAVKITELQVKARVAKTKQWMQTTFHHDTCPSSPGMPLLCLFGRRQLHQVQEAQSRHTRTKRHVVLVVSGHRRRSLHTGAGTGHEPQRRVFDTWENITAQRLRMSAPKKFTVGQQLVTSHSFTWAYRKTGSACKIVSNAMHRQFSSSVLLSSGSFPNSKINTTA